jgi:hypothetical protein
MKKSQTNNRKQLRPKESELEMIDRHLMARTTLSLKGKKQSMTLGLSSLEYGDWRQCRRNKAPHTTQKA